MKKEILLGNEAIVRGALEAGVDFVSTYPGTPASEIGNTFAKIAKDYGVYFEFSTNEKVALEAAIGASFSGLKCLVAMKNFGLNVASDSLIPFCYTGTKGPTVIIVADDPSCWSSGQSEQNTRAYAYLAHIPMLEPSDAQEAKDFTRLAFEISAKFKIPIILRITTRVAHQRMPVKLSEIRKQRTEIRKKGKFIKDVKRFVTMPPRVLEMKEELLEKIEKIKEFAEKSPINQIVRGRTSGSSDNYGIITSGVSYLYVMEVLKELKLNLPVLKLGFFYPLPEKRIKSFIKDLKKVLIVEELEPYLEKEVRILAKEINPNLAILGKDILPITRELNPEKVALALSKITGKKYQMPRILPLDLPSTTFCEKSGAGFTPTTFCEKSGAGFTPTTFQKNSLGKQTTQKMVQGLPKRFPRLCAGCPYWFVFSAIKKAAPKGTIFGGDIGCYMLAGFPPHNIQDYLFCMGSSIGIAHGIGKSTKQKIIALIGDSTFFHAGIPALINAVFNKSNPLIIVMDNRITAMTGHQPHPGMGKTGMGETTKEIKIEDIAKACGVENVKVIDPINIKKLENTIKEFLNKKETSMIIARRICAYLAKPRTTFLARKVVRGKKQQKNGKN